MTHPAPTLDLAPPADFCRMDCDYCGCWMISTKGKKGGNYYYELSRRRITLEIIACPCCHMFGFASLVTVDVPESRESQSRIQFPPAKEIPTIEGLPDRVKKDYEDAFHCFCIGNWTGCAMTCRQMLMSVAVDKGAKKGEGFDFYVKHLKKQKDVPESIHENLDKIRGTGNEVIHKMPDSIKGKAKDAFIDVVRLLIAVYEKPIRDRRREVW